MLDKILQIEKKYNELGITLSDPAVIQDYNKFRDLSKQRKSMEETVNLYYDWKKAVDAIEEAKEMIKAEHDEEMKNFLKAEMAENEAKLPEYEERMKVLLLPRDPMDDKDIMLEIRGGAGGDEANIFAGDLARMYMRYADKKIEITLKNDNIIMYNDGPNIDENILNDIFTPYKKGINGQFGLGLSIVKKTLMLCGYEITVKNEKKGISFVINKL